MNNQEIKVGDIVILKATSEEFSVIGDINNPVEKMILGKYPKNENDIVIFDTSDGLTNQPRVVSKNDVHLKE